MERTFYLVVATFLGLAFSSCTNDVTDEMIAEASGKSSNEESEVVELNSGFTITKMNHLTIYEQSEYDYIEEDAGSYTSEYLLMNWGWDGRNNNVFISPGLSDSWTVGDYDYKYGKKIYYDFR